MLFNGLWGGTDDHERNHPAFWDGRTFTLALRHLPQPLAGNEFKPGDASPTTLASSCNLQYDYSCSLTVHSA